MHHPIISVTYAHVHDYNMTCIIIMGIIMIIVNVILIIIIIILLL